MPPGRWTDEEYRNLIDELVDRCRSATRFADRFIAEGRWPFGLSGEPANSGSPAQKTLDRLLTMASAEERTMLSALIEYHVTAGAFEALVMLSEHDVEPFNASYLGDSYRDFLDRLAGGEWWLDGGWWGSSQDPPERPRHPVNARLTPSARLFRSRRR